MDRRTFLGLSAGATILATRFSRAQAPPAQSAAAAPTLREAGAAKGILAGTAVGRGALDDPAMAQLIVDQYNILVCENDMKWAATQPEQDRYDFTRPDAVVAFAEAHGQLMRGHNLCWHVANPKWLTAAITPQNAAALLEDHVRTVAGHYAGKIQSWDVVNEAVLPEDGRSDGLRKSIWLQALGPDYLELAYRTAAAADPQARLTYNEYDLERDNPLDDRKRKYVIELLRSFRKKNIPLHALGIQSHLTAGLVPATWKGLNRFLDQVHDLGLEVYITEMDVDDVELPGDIPARDRMVADMYRSYLETVLRHPAVKEVLTWGFTDKYSWLIFSRERRPDGQRKRPLPFDADLRPKPAFDAMIEALQNG
jgi:endo-1,4-beta-xylanase